MRVAVDARALRSGRGISRWVNGLLGTLADVRCDDEWVAVVPGREPLPPVAAGVRLVRTRLPSRAVWGAAALAGRPLLVDLAGGADACWIPAPAPVAIGAPYVLSVHDRSWERRPADFTLYERAWHVVARPRALARAASAVTAVSWAMADDIRAAWGIDAHVVSPGIDGVAVSPRPGHYLLWVGALEPRKGPEVLAEAYARARARGLEAELIVVGEGREPLDGPGVVRLGRVDDRELAALYAGARALVAPSRLEGFGLAPLEAAVYGTPAVVSDLPSFAETLGEAALRVPVGDPGALADALLRVTADDGLRARLGAAARERAAAYTWQRAALALHALLADAAA
jgi:glycosyltransferase involved in cell wall biosynthesis